MPTVTAGKVLVTGANGYVAGWIIKLLIDAGYSVKGAVRSESKASHLRTVFSSLDDRFEVVIVPDITKEEAFIEHVKDVDAIAHTASPVGVAADDPDELIKPAVEGTLSVLKAAASYGTSVKRIITISSTAATNAGEPGTYDESAWNETSLDEVKRLGASASRMGKYRASKTLAERAAWEWYEERKGTLVWDLVVLVPVFIFGPPPYPVSGIEDLNPSLKLWYNNVIAGNMSSEDLTTVGGSYVDVRDVAQAHISALQKLEAGGLRLILSAGPHKFQNFVSAAHKISEEIGPGNTAYDATNAVHAVIYNSAKAIDVLGMKYHTIDELTRDTIESLKIGGMV